MTAVAMNATASKASRIPRTCRKAHLVSLNDSRKSAKTLTIKLDKTPPTIVGSRSPAPNVNGWNNSPVTVSFACSDNLSGLAPGSPPANTVLSSEGADQQVTGACQDLAGNMATATVTGINID